MDSARSASAGTAAVATSSGTTLSTRAYILIGFLIVGGLIFFLTGFFAFPANNTSDLNSGLRYFFTFFGGIVAFGTVIMVILKLTGSMEGVKLGDWKPIALIVVVSVIAFAIVFAPAMTRTGTTLDPYLIAFIVLLCAMAVVGILLFLYYKSSQFVGANIITRISLILAYFLPYALLMFGPIVDIITFKTQFLPSTVVGLTGIFMNWIFATYFNGGTPPTSQNIECEIPGLSMLSSNLVPQPMMASLSILAYIATYISRSTLTGSPVHPSISFTNPASVIWPAWLLYGVISGAYLGVFAYKKCMPSFVAGVRSLAIPTLWGSVFGILGFEFLAPRYDQTGPTGLSPPPAVLGAGKGSTAPIVGTCAAGSSDGEFICESFENGKLKTKVMTE